MTLQRTVASPIALSGALLLAVAAACSDATAPGGTPSTFTAQSANVPFPPAAPTVEVTSSSIVIDGSFATPDPCFAVSGSASMAHDTVVVRIVAKETSKVCVLVLGGWRYTLTVQPRPSGANAVRVIHDSGIGEPKVVLEQGLALP